MIPLDTYVHTRNHMGYDGRISDLQLPRKTLNNSGHADRSPMLSERGDFCPSFQSLLICSDVLMLLCKYVFSCSINTTGRQDTNAVADFARAVAFQTVLPVLSSQYCALQDDACASSCGIEPARGRHQYAH